MQLMYEFLSHLKQRFESFDAVNDQNKIQHLRIVTFVHLILSQKKDIT
jgi:hypothetical protein